jgi:uncharacterized protein YigE (DUF2233 family)
VNARRVAIAVLGLAMGGWGVQLVAARPAPAPSGSLVKTVTFRGARFDVVELPLAEWDVRVDWRADGGSRLKDVEGAVRTNAGIFEPRFVPTGLLISDGVELRPLETASGEGNFYLAPNGVFSLGERGAAIVETSEWKPGARFATQSGPLLVRRSVLHPKLTKGSSNVALRSGVGVRSPGVIVLAISRDDVNLWTFAALFRDELDCPDALYLDGAISALWAKDAGREAELEKGPFAGILSARQR